jgi:RNA polymerase sigma-70 factor (ECF subfamily)
MRSESRPAESADAWEDAWPQSREDFERLVDAFLQRLVQYAYRRLGNMHDAEDAVQEVFVRAYARRSDCASVSPAGPYLYRMAANACTDLLRKRKRSHVSLDGIDGGNIATEEEGAELRVALEEICRAEELLRRLPKKQAEVIRLRVFDGLRVNQIAEVVGCSANTVSSRLRYGFGKLRRIVSREWKQ